MTKLNRSVERGLNILEVISSNGVCSLAFLAERTGLPKPTILRICATLVQQRWLSQSRSDSRYRVGSRFPRVNAHPDSIDALVEAGASAILALSEATGLGVDLAAPIGNGRVEIVDTTRTFSEHGVFPDCIGYRPSPFRSALGCAFLAALDPAQEAEYTARLAVHTTGRDRVAALALPAKLREVRVQGFATREDGYWGRAVDYGGIPSAIAVAISSRGHIVGAVSLIWLAEQHSVASVAKAHLKKLTATAREIGELYAAHIG